LTENENKTVIGKIVELANLRNLDEMLEYFTDDVTAQWHGGERRDKKGIREIFENSYTIWSDGVYRVDRMISEGDMVVARASRFGRSRPSRGSNGKVYIYMIYYSYEECFI
jgi:ketosteroid isomerase-like protein